MWALAEVMANTILPDEIRDQAKIMFILSLKEGSKLTHIRAKAFAIKSFALAIGMLPDYRNTLRGYIATYADALLAALKKNSFKSWTWFEKELNYSNGLLPESLLVAGTYTNNPLYLDKGMQALRFLMNKTFSPDMYMPIGHSHWYKNNAKRSQYDQQPEDPASMILALTYAYQITYREEYKNMAKKCFSWFLGNNSLNTPLYDAKTGGCYDGLHPDRVNMNQGAESLVSYLMASYSVTTLH
jgi:uncharacterized protein YyaL (SSP411 family)